MPLRRAILASNPPKKQIINRYYVRCVGAILGIIHIRRRLRLVLKSQGGVRLHFMTGFYVLLGGEEACSRPLVDVNDLTIDRVQYVVA